MDNSKPLVNLNGLVISGDCFPVTPTPSTTPYEYCYVSANTESFGTFQCPNDGLLYQDVYGKLLLYATIFGQIVSSHPDLTFIITNGVEYQTITILDGQEYTEFVYPKINFFYTETDCLTENLPDWSVYTPPVTRCSFFTPTPTPTQTPTNTQTPTQTPTNTQTPTQTPTPSITASATQTPTNTTTPTITNSQTPTPTITPSVTPNYQFTSLFFSAGTTTGTWQDWNGTYTKVDNTSRYLSGLTLTVCDEYLDRPYMLLSGTTGGFIGLNVDSSGNYNWNLYTTGTTSDTIAVCGNDRLQFNRLIWGTVTSTLINGINAPLQGLYLGTGLRPFSLTWNGYPFNPQPVPTPSPTPTTIWYYYNVTIFPAFCGASIGTTQIKTNRELTINYFYCYTPDGINRIRINSVATPNQSYTLQTCYTGTATCAGQPSPGCFCP
jgi:hypothetical protein